MKKSLNIFVRQPFTETSLHQQELVNEAFNVIKKLDGLNCTFNFLTSNKALNKENFITDWEKTTNKKFTPTKFRNYRIAHLNKADLFINIRTSMSESSAFEIAYNAYHKKIPMFFAVWENAPIRTTLLRDLEDLCDVQYCTFSNPQQFYKPLNKFINKTIRKKYAAKISSNIQ